MTTANSTGSTPSSAGSAIVSPPTPKTAISIRATLILMALVTFGFLVFAGIAVTLRVVPSAQRIALRGALARDDYAVRTRLAAQLDTSITDLWRLLRVARTSTIPADSVAVRRQRLEVIVRGSTAAEPLRRDQVVAHEFATGLERADAATSRAAAALLGALAAIETGDVPNAEILMSRADSLDAPLTERLNEVTQVALADLARDEQLLERDARFASRLLLFWLGLCVLAAPLLWQLLNRRLVQPLGRIDHALHRIEGGDLGVSIPVLVDDELGRLAAHFNRTTLVLQAQRAEGERAAAQLALEESEARYRVAFEQAAVGLAEVALDGKFLRINRALRDILSRDDADIIGHTFYEFAHPDDLSMISAGFARAREGDHSAGRVERRYIRGDGSTAIAQTTSTLVRHSADQSPRHVLVVVHDVTEQRRLERELLQATKLEAVGQLAGGVAHDFNNLLAGIIGYAELLEDNTANPIAVREDAASIKRAALKGADLSRSLLTLAGRNTRRDEPFALNPVVYETVELLRRTIDRRVDVKVTIEQAPTIRGDRSMVANALLNLAVNARDAMPDGGTLAIESRLVHPDAAFRLRHGLPADTVLAAIHVVDSGEGMSSDVLQRVFEPFFTTKSPGKGTGLGLSMVYGTVKDHGGVVTIDSTPGQGTRVTLYLPCSEDAVKANTPAFVPAASAARARILVVDDEPMVRNVAKRMLERLGYTVELADDGLAALARLDSDVCDVDLVIVDGNMPRLNGLETARRLHARHPALPMIFATGHFDPAGRENLAALGFVDRIEKPFSLERLSTAVAQVLAPPSV